MTRFFRPGFGSERAVPSRRAFAALCGALALILGIAGLAFGALAEEKAASVAGGSAGEAAAPDRQPWSVNCSGQGKEDRLVCSASQTLVAKANGQRIVTVGLVHQAGDQGLVATVALPHGLLLTKGVELWIDGGARKSYDITTADQNGSYATIPVDAKLVNDLKKGAILNVGVHAATGEAIVLQLSLSGIGAALAKL